MSRLKKPKKREICSKHLSAAAAEIPIPSTASAHTLECLPHAETEYNIDGGLLLAIA
jgi:hypothetical protein